MAGSKEGAQIAMQSLLNRLGSPEKVSEWRRATGRKGGKAPHKTPRGFAARPDIVSIAGKKGGSVSRRGSTPQTTPAEQLAYDNGIRRGYYGISSDESRLLHYKTEAEKKAHKRGRVTGARRRRQEGRKYA